MARTISQIYSDIVAAKDSQAPIAALAPTADTEQQLLTDLNSTSKVAIWRLWAYIVAVATYTHEVLWDLFKAEVQAIADSAIVGTIPWYQGIVFAFQNGDTLTYNSNTGKYEYPVIDPSHQVVKRCSVVEQQDGVLAFKVAKLDGAGLPISLTSGEQSSLAMYIKKVRFAGTRFTLISGNGDILRIPATVYFDGVITEAVIAENVELAITSFVGSLPFNGEFLLSKLVDTIQAVEGVQDVVLGTVQTKQLLAGTYGAITRVHVPAYGYYRIDSTTGNTLSDTLTYVPQ